MEGKPGRKRRHWTEVRIGAEGCQTWGARWGREMDDWRRRHVGFHRKEKEGSGGGRTLVHWTRVTRSWAWQEGADVRGRMIREKNGGGRGVDARATHSPGGWGMEEKYY